MAAWDDRFKLVVRSVVSLSLLVVAFFILLFNGYPDATVKWAYGAIGLVAGYWLR